MKRLVELALQHESVGHITWGLRHCTEAHRMLEERARSGDRNAAELLAEIRP
ncbi:MAG: hypothetical protein QGH74_02565 [Candidatus Brocadiia bacterium]|nr:hypothetical protein [Candidatus Brocadiia bacterium]